MKTEIRDFETEVCHKKGWAIGSEADFVFNAIRYLSKDRNLTIFRDSSAQSDEIGWAASLEPTDTEEGRIDSGEKLSTVLALMILDKDG